MRTATATGLGGLAGTVGSAVAAAPATLVVALGVVVVALLLVALCSDRTAERAALLIAALRGQRTVPRLPRQRGWAKESDPR